MRRAAAALRRRLAVGDKLVLPLGREDVTVGTPTFGIFDHIEDIPGTPANRLFTDRLALIAMADEAGFSGYYLAEHHGSGLCMAPSQEIFIAAASQVTKNIRLGP